ncbi:MAG: topoisomerase IV [Oscillospiraceae bacterium]|nr:topoisomerase IV [Oscillospiraceae bacterium]
MAKKKNPDEVKHRPADPNVMGLRKEVVEQPITQTLEINFMPYAMSVIMSRAIPEIDGFKPSHRKLLYTMYQMKLLNGNRTKSANIVGQTMRLNPHGDAAIYDTMVRLSRGYGALLHPFVDSKGNFGKVYSRDMAWAASRYTEAKLDGICQELFRDIDQDTVDFVDNYDGSMKEPTLLPTTFPNVLVSANQGIAVGMASNLCGFNLQEVCEATIAFMKDPECDLLSILKAPDFPTGGQLLYDGAQMAEIYRTGRGSFQVRAKWRYIKEENIIEVYEIPYTATAEAIMDKVTEMVKAGKLKEIADMRDETDLSGLKLTIDLKRGTDPEKLMAKLFKSTPMQDSFPCNFNILIAGMPKVLGVRQILEEWVAWRIEGVRRRTWFVQKKQKDKLHLLKGLKKILLDIDKAIQIIRDTELDAEVIPNLMIGFGIDQIQAEYVADIRLRNINKEYILKRVAETEDLEKEIADLQDILDHPNRVKTIIAGELKDVMKKYPSPRRTEIIYEFQTAVEEETEDDTPDYPVHVFLSKEGYLKKITPQSLRMASDQKYKEGDGPSQYWESTNRAELLVFTNQQQCYKTRLADFDDAKASVLGDYLPTKLAMDPGETAVWALVTTDYSGHLLFFFANGKAARVELAAYQTQTRRKKLANAYSDKSPLVAAYHLKEDMELALTSTEGRCLVFHTAVLAPKTTRNTQGVGVMTIKKEKHHLESVRPLGETAIQDAARYRARSLPVAGSILKPEDRGEKQLSLLE